jgi:hypothetical protein
LHERLQPENGSSFYRTPAPSHFAVASVAALGEQLAVFLSRTLARFSE